LTINSLTTPGFGGRIYFPTAVGKGFYVLQVRPEASAPAASSRMVHLEDQEGEE
jgi:hypothetical protein